ncbi:hypothetical protein AN644_03430 [Candidatus Epulonipiscium fishelsonii]|nr:hypothetical protein AN644_03430 [Epulopiscium sp. SCG-C06WGA-EpuloA1]
MYNTQINKLQSELNETEKLYESIKVNLQNKTEIVKDNNLLIENKTNITNKYKNELIELKNVLDLMKETFKTDDFKKELDNINKMEARRKSYQEKQNVLLNRNKVIIEEHSKLQKLIQEEKDKLNKISGQIEEKVKDIELKQQNILEKADKNQLQEVIDRINQINMKWKDLDKQKQEVEKEYINHNNKHLEFEVKSREASSKYIRSEEKLKDLLDKYNYSTIDEARKDYIKPEDIEQFEKSIKNYYEELTQSKYEIDKLIELIGSRFVTDEELRQTKFSKTYTEDKVNRITAESIKIKEQIIEMSKKLEDMKEITMQSETLEHKLSMLKELQNVLKGKKLVQFVATERLKYVANEASKKLLDITNGNYGLESDNDGNFIIRDYKNGGIVRDTTTLSGGETFLVSLALALALSVEIQLKGTSPLELFFLDEGFGTLDEDLLDIVMSSLEKLHHDKLKVGIISHVESIKNRVPVKLLVSPSKSGEGGSKVKIERS